MIEKFEEFQKLGQDNAELAETSFASFQKGAQAIAVEVADYSKKSFEESSAAFEKLLGAKSLDKAIEIQTSYFKNAYEAFVAEATKLGELYSDVAKDAYKPFEGVIAKATTFKV
jgi:phasin family protein